MPARVAVDTPRHRLAGRARTGRDMLFDRYGTRGQHPVNYAPGRSGEQRHVEADNTRAHRLLGWQPRVPFETGLADTVQWSKASVRTAAVVR